MKTFSGHNAPLPSEYQNDGQPADAVDIVFHLGRTRRFGGWGHPEWTVLHHVVLATNLWLKKYGAKGAHFALLHDYHEAYIGDIPSPIKQCLGTEGKKGLKALADHLDQEIYHSLGVELPDAENKRRIKVVDFSCLLIEARQFGTPGTVNRVFQLDWPNLPTDLQDDIIDCIERHEKGLFSFLVAQSNLAYRLSDNNKPLLDEHGMPTVYLPPFPKNDPCDILY